MQDRACRVVVHNLGLAAEDEAYGSAQTHGCQRFIRYVEQQHSSHRTSRWRRLDYLNLMLPVCRLVRSPATP